MAELDQDPDELASAERTDLAWSRSGLAVLACLAIVARRFFPLDTRADHLAAYVLLGGGGLVWAGVLLVGRRGRPMRPGGDEALGRLRLATLSTVAVAVAAFALGLFPPDV